MRLRDFGLFLGLYDRGFMPASLIATEQTRIQSVKPHCECSDPGCPVHHGISECKNTSRLKTLYRIDMEDRTGTQFCPRCANDAYESGLFDQLPNQYSM